LGPDLAKILLILEDFKDFQVKKISLAKEKFVGIWAIRVPRGVFPTPPRSSTPPQPPCTTLRVQLAPDLAQIRFILVEFKDLTKCLNMHNFHRNRLMLSTSRTEKQPRGLRTGSGGLRKAQVELVAPDLVSNWRIHKLKWSNLSF